MTGPDPVSHSEPPPLPAPLWTQRKVQWLCTGLGAWGVGTGFAVFILLWTHGRSHPYFFLASLLVAALIAYVAELLRDLIREGVAIPAITGPRVVVTMLLLMIIELVVHAGTAIVQMGGDVQEAASANSDLKEILTPLVGLESNMMTEVVGLAIAWVLVGAVVARRLSRIVFLQVQSNRQGLIRGAREGVIGGLVAAPLCALACQLIVRAFSLAKDFVVRPEAWAQEVQSSLRNLRIDDTGTVLLKLPEYLWLGAYYIGRWGHGIGGAALAVLILSCAVWAWRHRSLLWVRVVAVVVPLLLLAPLPTEFHVLVQVALLAIVIWVVPGFILGVTAPLLRGAGDEPRLWGIIAFASAALLSLLTLLKFASPWCYALAFGLVIIGFLFFRGASLREYWPLAAAAMASMVSGVMVIVEKATFLGVVSEAHEIYRLPLVRQDALLAAMDAMTRSLESEVPSDSDDIRKVASRVQGLANLSPQERVNQLKEIRQLIAEIKRSIRGGQAAYLRQLGEGPLVGIATPPDGATVIYNKLADLEEHPPARDQREAVFGQLSSQADKLIVQERDKEARDWRLSAGVTDSAEKIEAAIKSGNASEDTAQFGPTLGALVADLYNFQTLPDDARAQKGGGLRKRLSALINDHRSSDPADASDSQDQASPETPPIEGRLNQLWNQLSRELVSRGSGGFSRPRRFTGDPAGLYWRSVLERSNAAAPFSGLLVRPLDRLRGARATIESERVALAEEQEPAAQVAAAGKSTDRPETVKLNQQASDGAMNMLFPAGARRDRLIDILRQLTQIQASAEQLKESWGAPPAMTLELCLVGSFGFWVTVALLASWSLTEVRRPGEGHA